MITLPGNPLSTNHLYKRHGHIIYMSAEGKQTKEMYQWQAKTQWRGNKCLTGPLELVVRLYFSDNRRRDIDNYHKLSLDALSGIVYEDDKQIQKMTVEKFVDKPNPRIEIEIHEQRDRK